MGIHKEDQKAVEAVGEQLQKIEELMIGVGVTLGILVLGGILISAIWVATNGA